MAHSTALAIAYGNSHSNQYRVSNDAKAMVHFCARILRLRDMAITSDMAGVGF